VAEARPHNGRMHLSAAARSGARLRDMGSSSFVSPGRLPAGRRPQVMGMALCGIGSVSVPEGVMALLPLGSHR
jgi:hypothetical protein